MSLGDALMKIKSKAVAFAYAIWNQDFSHLEYQFLGVSMIDILGFILSLYIIFQIIKFIINAIGELLSTIVKNIFTYIATLVMLRLQKVFLRAKHTAHYLWNHEKTMDRRRAIKLRIDTLYYRFMNSKNQGI